MKNIYTSPLKVYLIIGILALIGLFSGSKLPISLFPNSTKAELWVDIKYGNLTNSEFLLNYGKRIESKLKSIIFEGHKTQNVLADYGRKGVSYKVGFNWGVDPESAKNAIKSEMSAISASWPSEIRDSLSVNSWSGSSGFVAISFFSKTKSINEVYQILNPIFTPELDKIKDAENIGLWNPERKKIFIRLNSIKMANYGLFPSDIQKAISNAKKGFLAGSLRIGRDKLIMSMKREVQSIETLKSIQLRTMSNKIIQLSEVADIQLDIPENSQKIIKTSGHKSLVLFGSPKNGGNIKKLSEDVLKIVRTSISKLNSDIDYKVLVDPSEFIRNSVNNVIHEVFIASALAVFILFLFVGSLRNTITAIIEIPLAMILAFILMSYFDMNINLISLGGLALVAGMNVDASVVVMENIFRNFSFHTGYLTFEEKTRILVKSVQEVFLPIVASTVSTLVVFSPLAFTSDLTYAILGDLAKVVVFSHGFSMVIALILVPTIRLQLMGKKKNKFILPKSILAPFLSFLENIYSKSLNFVLIKQKAFIVGLVLFFIGGIFASVKIIPALKREIVGKPHSDWIYISIRAKGNTFIKQMEEQTTKIEHDILEKYGSKIDYTFTQIRRARSASIMARLKDKHDMKKVWKSLEKEFVNTPELKFWIGPWNPSELPLPNPPHMKIAITGEDLESNKIYAKYIFDRLKEEKAFDRNWTQSSVSRREEINLGISHERFLRLRKNGINLSPYDITDILRVASDGKNIDDISIDNKNYSAKLLFSGKPVQFIEDIESFPLAVDGKIIPLKALVDVSVIEAAAPIYRENGNDVIFISAKNNEGSKLEVKPSLKKAKDIVSRASKDEDILKHLKVKPHFEFLDANIELTKAIDELTIAIIISLLLIMLTILFQFGNLMHTGIIMVSIPFGVLGGLFSLWAFGSTLSLNSILGIILLNGISVNNSIILVDFILKEIKRGKMPFVAALSATKTRLRPILITTLTTVLGMLPIALGFGEGGKVLKPLGIVVTSGLWFSTLFTLFVIPLLEVMYLNYKAKNMTQVIDFETDNLEPVLNKPMKIDGLAGDNRNEI